MGLRLDLANASRPSKSLMEVKARSLMCQNLEGRGWGREEEVRMGQGRGEKKRAPFVANTPICADLLRTLRHVIDETPLDSIADAKTIERNFAIRRFLFECLLKTK